MRLPSGLILNFGTFPANAMVEDKAVSGGYKTEVVFKEPYSSWYLPIVAADYGQGLPAVSAYRGTRLDRMTLICNVNVSNAFVGWMAIGW